MFAAIIVILGAAALLIGLAFIESWVASVLWGWFVVPAFGAPPMSFLAACGIAMTVRLLTGRYTIQSGSKDDSGGGTALLRLTCFPLVLLLVGYVIKSLM